jgi:tryptophanyl-tRNA synthetase
MMEHFAPYREKREDLISHKEDVIDMLQYGAKKAKRVAGETISNLRKAVGLSYDA